MANILKELPESCRSDFLYLKDVLDLSSMKIRRYKDHIFTPGFEPETIEYAFNHHEPGENDVLVASFNRTGTTWTREIVRQILYGRDEKLNLLTQDLALAQIYLESGFPKKYNVLHNLPIPRKYYVTHLPAELVNLEKYKSRNMKVIYTLRNPKDRLVSCFHYVGQFPMVDDFAQFDVKNWDNFFKQQTQGLFPFCMKKGEYYFEHILSWRPHIRDNKNAMIVVYEEMVKDHHRGVKQIAEFLGVKLKDEEINEICRKTEIGTMKKNDAESKSEDAQCRQALSMLRKGKIGEWKDYLTEEQSAYIDAEVEEKLKGTGIKFIYE